jgi:quinoprotein glucose dehydrogenase
MSKLCVFVSLCLLASSVAFAQQNGKSWKDYGGSPDNSHYVATNQITKSNVGQLEVAWTYSTGDNDIYYFNPVIVDDVMYVLARNNSLVALDATTGTEIWVHENLTGIARRGINYWESKDGKDRRLIFQMNQTLQEIDARTGKSILMFGEKGIVNLREGLGRDPKTIYRVQSSTPGKIFENLIILGSSTGEGFFATPGYLRAFDVRTGKLVWTFHTIPNPGEYGYDTWPKDAWKYIGGVNTWGEITVDEKRGIAYFPTGSATYDYYGADRIGTNLFANCLLALDARTGKRLWHFQFVHHDLLDYDGAAAPQLLSVKQNGKKIEAVAIATKQGFVFTFDRVNGKPLFSIQERPVPESDMPGEVSWPTQPFPSAPPAFARQKLTADEINPYILTPEERAKWKDTIANARNRGLYTPPSMNDTVAIPGARGGANWGSTSANSSDGTFYVASSDAPSIYKMSLDAPGSGGGAAARAPNKSQELSAKAWSIPVAGSGGVPIRKQLDGRIPVGSSPYSQMEGPAYPDDIDAPKQRYYTDYNMIRHITSPPWSTLTAFDLNKGTIKWQIPLGEDVRAVAEGVRNTGTMLEPKGILVTPTGLVFHAARDGKVRAYDAEQGKELWSGELPAGSTAIPAMYEVKGRVYLVVSATAPTPQLGIDETGVPQGNSASTAAGAPHAYVVFALGGKRK